MCKYCFFILGFISVASEGLFAQVLNLDSIVTHIDRDYPELQMYDAQIKAYDTYATGAKAWDAPQVSTGFFMTPYNPGFWSPNTMDVKGKPSSGNGMGMYMFQVQQMIPNPSKLRANQKYMQGMSSVDKENKKITRNQLIAEAKNSYYAWIVMKKKQKILSDIELLMKYIIESSEARYSYEQDKLNNIYKAKSELLKLNNMQIMLENDIKEKMIELNRLMNRDKNIQFAIDTVYTIKDYDKQITDTSQIADFRSDVKALDRNMEVSRLKQKYELSQRNPDFGIRYDHMFTFGQNSNLFTLMGMISIPIAPWSSKMYKAKVAGLNYEIRAYQKQKETIVNEVTSELQMLRIQTATKKRQIKLYETGIIPALEKNYKTTLLAYEQNTEDLFIVLDAVQNLLMTQMEYLNQLQELLQLQVAYEKQIELN